MSDGERDIVDELTGEEPELAPGDMVGEYRIEAKIGEGAYGTVYSAEHPVIGKRAAVKVLQKQFSSVPEIVSRFISEARAVNRIRHRNIIDVFSMGKLESEQQYLVMELLNGETLEDILARRERLPFEEAYPILKGVADGLDAAHAVPIAHRDLKPDNVFVARSKDGFVLPKLLDFGIAKLLGDEEAALHKTKTGLAVGTPLYMSPEQCRAKGIDQRTDIYSFGILTFRTLSGTIPFDGESAIDVMFKHMSEEVPSLSERHPDLRPELDEPIRRMMAKKAADRPATASEALQALVDAAIVAGMTVGDEALRASNLDLAALGSGQRPAIASSPGAAGPSKPEEPMDFGSTVLLDEQPSGGQQSGVPSDVAQRTTQPSAGSDPRDPLFITKPSEDMVLNQTVAVESADAEERPMGTTLPSADDVPPEDEVAAASIAALSSTRDEEVAGKPMWLYAGVAVAVVGVAGVAFSMMGDSGAGAASMPTTKPEATTAPTVTATADVTAQPTTEPTTEPTGEPTADAKPSHVSLALSLTPPDAVVKQGGRTLAVKDGKVELPFATDEIELEISRAGYRPKKLFITPNRDQPLEVTLAALGGRPPPKAPPPPPGGTKPPPPPSNNLDDLLGNRN